MLTKYNFELELEKTAEEFYFNAASALVAPRGGNSRSNEVYFGWTRSALKKSLQCQHLILKKGKCPDSGIFGDFFYKEKDEINWDAVERGEIVVLEVDVLNAHKQYIEVKKQNLGKLDSLTTKSKITLHLNDLNIYGEFFGIEYKASKNKNRKSISVASFNSTCPSDTKTVPINKVKMIHSLETKTTAVFDKNKKLKISIVNLTVQISMYYFIVNDEVVNDTSVIRHMFISRGGFFSPGTTEADAKKLSKEVKPESINVHASLYRVKLRYRPFFDSRKIDANGFGLYTSWEPKIPGLIKEEKQREALLKEVEKVKQTLEADKATQSPAPTPKDEDNVIYLSLREERIRRRSAA